MMERNEALLRKVGDVIAAEPERYNQQLLAVKAHGCGTIACVAGHAWLLAGTGLWSNALVEARHLLGLDVTEASIFHGDWRPAGDPSVPLHERVQAALYALAEGASVEEVTAGTEAPNA